MAEHEATPMAGSLPSRRFLPLNSRKLTTPLLKQLAKGLGLSTTASLEENRQLIGGKLEEMDREPKRTQAIVEKGTAGMKVTEEDGVFMEVEPEEPVEGEEEESGDEEEDSEPDELRQELKEATKANEALQQEVIKLGQKLERERAKSKELWKMNCAQLSEFDSTPEKKDGEIAKLKRQLAAVKKG